MKQQLISSLCLCLAVEGATADTVVTPRPARAVHPDNVFTRMYPDLPAFAPQTADARRAVQQMARAAA